MARPICCRRGPEKDKPALVMRIDMGNPYNDQPPPRDVGRSCRTATSRSSARSRWMPPAWWSTCSCCPTSRSCSANASTTSPASAPPARQLRHAADDRAAGDAAQRGARRLPGRRRRRKDRHAGAPRGRDGRRHHQGRPDRAIRRISTASSRRRACRCWCAAAARRTCKAVLDEVGGADGAGRQGHGLWPQHLPARQPQGASSPR